jgi:hypothetical protein
MNEVENYLSKVGFHLIGIGRKNKKKIIDELKVHINDKIKSIEETNENIRKILADMGSPKDVAFRYREVYGYSSASKFLFIIVGGFLSVFTIPAFPFLSVFLLPVLLLYIIYVSLSIDKNTGCITGITGGVVRIIIPFFLFYTNPSEYIIADNPLSLSMFAFVSLLLVFVGYVPGYYKEKYKEKIESVF